MDTVEARLENRSRRAYELGRFAAASRRALPLVPLIALALSGCAAPRQVLVCGGVLLVAVTLLLWWGREFGAGVGPGIVAGLVPLLLPALTQLVANRCPAGGCLFLPAVCAFGGLTGGVLLGALARALPDASRLAATLDRLLQIKQQAHYGVDIISVRRANDAVRHAGRLLEQARDELERGR